jgi:hypothetical protein
VEHSSVSPLQKALEIVEALPPEDQETLIDLIQLRLIEKRRAEIAQNADATLKSIRENTARFGSIEDLRNDFSDDLE